MQVIIPFKRDNTQKTIKSLFETLFPRKFIPGLNISRIQNVINIILSIMTKLGSILIILFKISFN